MDATPHPVVLQQAQPSRTKRLKQRLRRLDRIFVVAVLVPTVLAVLYYGVIASDVYVSESRFVVRSPQRQSQTGLGGLLAGAGVTRSADDTYSVHDYVLSRDALKALDTKLKFRQRYGSHDIDVFDRFPGLDPDDSFENLYLYYTNHVTVTYDTTSSITTLEVRSFSADMAQKMNDELLSLGEGLVNRLNERSQQDMVRVAEREVRDAQEASKVAAFALASFRTKRSIVDPDRQSAYQLESVGRLQEELRLIEVQLAQIRLVSPTNPQIPGLMSQLDVLRGAISAGTSQVMGGGESLVAKAPTYDRLLVENTFAEKQLASALTSLETARSDAARKQLYLERLVEPSLPDYPNEPRRVRSVLLVLALGLIAWGVLSLIVASVREHAD